MASNDPKQSPPNPTPPDPPPASANTPVAVASFNFAAGVKFGLPGKKGFHNGLKSTPPSKGEYWSIAWDRGRRHHVVAHFRPGPDLKRLPDDTLNIPEALVTWRPA